MIQIKKSKTPRMIQTFSLDQNKSATTIQSEVRKTDNQSRYPGVTVTVLPRGVWKRRREKRQGRDKTVVVRVTTVHQFCMCGCWY